MEVSGSPSGWRDRGRKIVEPEPETSLGNAKRPCPQKEGDKCGVGHVLEGRLPVCH